MAIVFNTRFNVNNDFDRKVLWGHVRQWIQGMRNQWPDIGDVPEGKEYSAASTDNKQTLTACPYDEKFAVQVKTSDSDAIYTTSLVLDDSSETHSLHVSMDKTFTSVQADNHKRQYTFGTPKILKQIFWNEAGADDNGLPTDNRPYILRLSAAEQAAGMLKGTTPHIMPIVYVSPEMKSGLPAFDAVQLADDLMGQAHVVVEGSPVVAEAVKKAIGDQPRPEPAEGSTDSTVTVQPYDGAVKIIFPGGCTRLMRKLDPATHTTPFETAITSYVKKAMAAVEIDPAFSIPKLRYEQAVKKLASGVDNELVVAAEEIIKDKEELIKDKDNELAILRNELDEAKQQVYSLTSKLDSMSNKKIQSEGNIPLTVSTKEMYPGEAADVILSVLEKAISQETGDPNLEGTHKYEIMQDIIASNTTTPDKARLESIIKEAFGKGNVKDILSTLTLEGFTVKDKEGRTAHHKIYYEDFEKYFVTVPSTPSDYRSLKNTAADLKTVMFGK